MTLCAFVDVGGLRDRLFGRNQHAVIHALAGREGAPSGGRTETEFLAQYETLRTEARASDHRPVRPALWPPGTGGAFPPTDRYGYGAPTDAAIASAQRSANLTGEPVDIVVH